MLLSDRDASASKPKLRFLHSENALNAVKLTAFRRLETDKIVKSLLPESDAP